MDILLVPVFILISVIGSLIFENGAWLAFLIITVVLAGGASFLSGRALASHWRHLFFVVLAALALGGAARFLHFALAGNTLLSPYYYAVDSLVCVLFGLWGYRMKRASQMARQYGWLYQRAGPLNWRARRLVRNAAAAKSL